MTPPATVMQLDPGLPLVDVVERFLRPASALQRDVRVRAADLGLADGVVSVDGQRLPLRHLAARQLRALLGVAATSPSVVVRRALHARGERALLLRLDGSDVRAVLGDAFVPIDDVFERVARAIAAMRWRTTFIARAVEITEVATVVRLTYQPSRIAVGSGELFERGVEISNGETGKSALTITPLVWRVRDQGFVLALEPTLRIVHHRLGANAFRRDLRFDLAHALAEADLLLAR